MALLPTLITLGNGVCGMVAIFKIGTGMVTGREIYFHQAAWLILAAMIFDALDGFAARMTNTASPFGAQLDSLCDLVTFGVAPAFLVFAMTRKHGEFPDFVRDRLVPAVCVLYAMCALIRLARFTVETAPDESSHREFAGLPSPAAAGVLAAAVIPARKLAELSPDTFLAVKGALPLLALGTGLLMVSRVRYLHVINRLLLGRRRFVTLVWIALGASLVFAFHQFAIFLGFLLYAASGPAASIRSRFTRKAPRPGVPAAPARSADESLN